LVEQDFLPVWAGDLKALAWVTIIALLASHALFWRFRSRRLHQIANYVAVLIGGLSLISAGYQSRAQLADVRYQALSDRENASRERIRENLTDTAHLMCDLHYERSPDSPANFDQLVADQNRGCRAAQRLLADAGRWITTSDDPIAIPRYGQERLATRAALDDFLFVRKAVADYNAVAKVRKSYARLKQPSIPEVELAKIGPFLAALAFSLALGSLAFQARDHEVSADRSTAHRADPAPPTGGSETVTAGGDVTRAVDGRGAVPS
jgi:hypothetical protein